MGPHRQRYVCGGSGLLSFHVPDDLCVMQPGEEMEACEELALALSRGLQLDTQSSSRDSLQCSSGYSTQTATPCCSEDTIPSQGTRRPAFRAAPGEEAASQRLVYHSVISWLLMGFGMTVI